MNALPSLVERKVERPNFELNAYSVKIIFSMFHFGHLIHQRITASTVESTENTVTKHLR